MRKIKNISKKILLSITGRKENEWTSKLQEIKARNIKKVALFLEYYPKPERKRIFSALAKSGIKEIPFVHARHDMEKEEYEWLIKNYHTKYFNLHPHLFDRLKKLNGLHKKILLELGYLNHLHKNVDVTKIGGFCIDLSHFKASEERWTNEFEYILKNEKFKRLFIANHLNGYSVLGRRDIHTVNEEQELDYLKTLPNFVFGKYIALEMNNSIKDQLRFKKYIVKLLK